MPFRGGAPLNADEPMTLASLKNRWTIIEVLLGIAIAATVAGVVVPKVLSVRIARNEVAAAATLRTLMGAERVYANTHPKQGFSPTIRALTTTSPESTRPILDASFSSEPLERNGYVFTYSPSGDPPVGSYELRAEPLQPGISGIRHFYADESGHIRVSENGPADNTSTVLPD